MTFYENESVTYDLISLQVVSVLIASTISVHIYAKTLRSSEIIIWEMNQFESHQSEH